MRSVIRLAAFAAGLLAWPLLSATPAYARTQGAGEPAYWRPSRFHATAFQPLSRLGEDAVRVTYSSTRGSWSFELYKTGAHYRGEMVEFGWVHGRLKLYSWIGLGSSSRLYASVADGIDDVLARPQPAATASNNVTMVCTDGGSYVVERRTHDMTHWTKYDLCEDRSDGADIATAIVKVYGALACWIAPHAPGYCWPPRPDAPD